MSIVEVSQGVLRGVVEEGLHVFRGVPYAAPPVGELRWRTARPHPGWSGVREASRPGPSAPQPYAPVVHPVLGDHGVPPFDEDCLTLNLWTPGLDDARRPVLVWIHGGGFLTGSGSLPIYAGDTFARDGDLVVVSINYRIGPLGYLYGAGDPDVWLSDQLAALRWVREHIELFGGDPAKVTVAGQSGGAFSIGALVEHGGLFERAILQSPPLGLALPSPEEALERTAALLSAVGVDDVEGLRSVPWPRLIEGTFSVVGRFQQPGQWPLAFLPVLGRHPLESLAATELDILAGATRDEATFAIGPEESAAVTDRLFRDPLAELARRRAADGRPSWIYQFDLASPAQGGRFGATHCLELPFTFANAGKWTHAPVMTGLDPELVRELSAAMHGAWIAFARTGDPNHDGLPGWERHTEQNRSTMHFGLQTAIR